MNEQRDFWAGNFAKKYRETNASFDHDMQVNAWKCMLRNTSNVGSILECGCNIGRNLEVLRKLYPKAELSLIELAKETYEIAVQEIKPRGSFNGLIVDSSFTPNSFDLVFTSGVLIHVSPVDLYKNMEKMFNYSKRYILINEYFARQLEEVLYHGQRNKLYKMDFGRFFLRNFNVDLVDYGFLWGEQYDKAGFDDTTWWLFEKKSSH